LAFKASGGEIVCFLTQDATPINEFYTENLTKPFSEDSDIVMSYGRQQARKNATMRETLTREFNYPEKSFVRDKNDIEKMGIKAFFVTNVCSAYRRDAYLKAGGFDKDTIANEDMEICAKFLLGGKKVAYAHNAVVLHSHNFTPLQQFKRNFDIAVSLANHKNIFNGINERNEGWLLFRKVFFELFSKCHFLNAGLFVLECIFRVLGNMAGKRYRIFPIFLARRMSGQRNWWDGGKIP
jgi:rhamnosyltransferase